MKYLDSTALGGMPLEGNDLTWMTNGYLEAFKDIMNGFTPPGASAFVISGCVATVSGANVAISAGVVYLNDRIRHIDAVIKTPSQFRLPEIDEDQTFDPSGDEVFEDGTTHQTYVIDYALIIGSGSLMTQSDYIAAVNALPKLSHVWKFDSVIEPWVTVPVTAPFTTPGSVFDVSGNLPLQCRKMIGGRVELSGSFAHPVGSTGLIGTLPVGYRPNRRVYVPTLIFIGNGTPREQALRIEPDGTMRLGDSHVLTNEAQYGVDGQSFPLVRGL